MKSLKLICILSLCVASLLVGKTQAKTLFFDDFEGGLAGWPEMPTIVIDVDPDNNKNHVLVFDTTVDNQNADALFLEGYEELTDYTVRARVNIVGETANFAAIGFILRAETIQDYMLIEPANKRNEVSGILNIFERAADAWPIVADGELDIEMNKWYEFSVTVKGEVLTAYIDEKKIAEYSTVPYPAGGFGIREWMSTTLIDDFEVYDADGSEMPVEPSGKLAATWGMLKK